MMKTGFWTVAAGAALVGVAGCNIPVGDAQLGEAAGAEACVSKATRYAVQKALFDAAVAKFDGEPLAINDMRRGAKAKLDYVTLEAIDANTGKVDCSARFKIAIPFNVQEKFGGEDELLADITYSTAKAGDGSGRTVEVDGLDFAVTKIVDAFSGKLAKTKPEPKPAPPAQPKVATYKPSFNCGGKLSRVERMICTDPVLAQLDRQMAGYYYRALESAYDSTQRAAIKRDQVSWLKGIGECDNTACVEVTQRERIAYLRNNY